ncbi:MAG: hypothetical protein IKC37_03900, partial [Clostridia bacterium]|nr:hypothetical protein [Clostridia bacterium]
MSNKQLYLAEIRGIEGLNNAILYAINVYQKERKAEFFLVTDTPYTKEAEEAALAVGQKYLPDGFSAGLKIVKRT